LSHFAARAGMRGRQRIWDSEGKKRREKGRNYNLYNVLCTVYFILTGAGFV
jgi:hypothetical protein